MRNFVTRPNRGEFDITSKIINSHTMNKSSLPLIISIRERKVYILCKSLCHIWSCNTRYWLEKKTKKVLSCLSEFNISKLILIKSTNIKKFSSVVFISEYITSNDTYIKILYIFFIIS